MTPSLARRITAPLLTAVAVTVSVSASALAQASSATTVTDAQLSALTTARRDSAQRLFTPADVSFMTGMIAHHSQAITMSRWAPTHGANSSIQLLAQRIINSQKDEIATMQRWLKDRNQPVPDPNAPMNMPGMDMGPEHLMPGMLTHEQMQKLDSARGPDFDRLFLTDMIQHHTGAVSMVTDLFNDYGAAQDEQAFKLATDINADQTTEIARMKRMLVMLMFDEPADNH